MPGAGIGIRGPQDYASVAIESGASLNSESSYPDLVRLLPQDRSPRREGWAQIESEFLCGSTVLMAQAEKEATTKGWSGRIGIETT